MRPLQLIILTTILLLHLNAFGQKRLDRLRYNTNFAWVVDSLEKNLIVYYERNSYAAKNSKVLITRIKGHLKNTLEFIDVENYEKTIHYFILEDRARMKLLVGHETNGNANPKNNFVTAIFSKKVKSVYSNHELFHLIAMNLWGNPETWINEGLAVYSDKFWQGYDLHELSKYLIDNNKFISINRIARNLRKYDSMITYPLLGSFARFIDETYGRETIQLIWSTGRKQIKGKIGKDLEDLETEWLEMLNTKSYEGIIYPNNH